ncbi:MAG: hypothetical protein H0T05_01225 [Acidobacteria bacterium]|nr:hypothetical protein [Acidobacteriota bacterium]
MATVAYGGAAVFALAAASAAALRSGSEVARVFWALLFGGLLFKLLGDLGWGGTRLFGMGPSALVFHDVAHVLSYAVILAALLWLVARTTRNITLVAALDAASIMLSVGVLAWYFVLGPSAAVAGGLESPREILMTLSGSVFDAGFLFLSLLVLSTTRRPVFTGYLAAAFGAFLVADGAYLTLRSVGPYEMGNAPELAWALGMVFLGVGALKTLSSCSFARELEISPWRVASFWFGPLSPAIHLALLLAWGALYPPLPSYVLVAGAVLVVYLAFRISLLAYVSRSLSLEAQHLAVRGEQSRISEELHDTLKQSVYSVSLLLGTYQEAREREEPNAGETLDKALAAAREANYQVGRPIDELRARGAGMGLDPTTLLEGLLSDVEEYFGMRAQKDLRADLGRLSPEQLAAAYRIASEALWNAAKHSGAESVWLESRDVGSVTLLKRLV